MRILMTGAGSSFGAYVRQKLEEQGHQVYTVGNARGVDDYILDLSRPDNVQGVAQAAFYDACMRLDGDIDTLIYNAGVTHIDFIESHSLADFQKVLNINLVSAFLFAQEFVRRIQTTFDPAKAAIGGYDYRLIFTGSQGAKTGFRACPAYPASKAALHVMAQGLAREFADRLPITVLTVAPSSVDDSGMKEYAINSLIHKRGMTKEEAEAYNSKSSPMGYIPWEHVWDVFNFAVNSAPRTMSGSVIYMPAGMGL